MERSQTGKKMASLLIFRSDEEPFTEFQVFEIFKNLEGVSGFRKCDPPLGGFSADFNHAGDLATVDVDLKLRSISFDYSVAGVELAWRIQSLTSEPLRIIDESYSFDIPLVGFGSAADLEAAMDRASKKIS